MLFLRSGAGLSMLLSNPELEKINGIKPCSRCEKDSDHSYWNPNTLELTWTCPDGHDNKFKVN